MDTKRKKSFFYFNILFIAIYSSFNINAQELQEGKPLDKIIFTEQIPEEALATMPTMQLIQEYLKSRYSRYIFLYPNDINYAFGKAYNDFNGLRELLKRQDAAKSLVDIYQRMDPEAYEDSWTPVRKGQYSFTFVHVEILLAQRSILDSFTKPESKIVLGELLKKHELKTLHPDLYSMFDVQFNAYSIAKLLESKGKENGIIQTLSQTPGMDEFLKSGILINKEVLFIIIQNAKDFLNSY